MANSTLQSWPCSHPCPHLQSPSGFSSPFDLGPSHGPPPGSGFSKPASLGEVEALESRRSQIRACLPALGPEERLPGRANPRRSWSQTPEKVERAEAGVSAPETGMLPGVKRAVPAAQTLPQPGLGGSRLPSSTAGPWQLHLSLRGPTALGIPRGGGISTHLRPERGSQQLRLRVESPAAGVRVIPLRTASPIPPSSPASLPNLPWLSHAARQRWAGTQAALGRGRGAGWG